MGKSWVNLSFLFGISAEDPCPICSKPQNWLKFLFLLLIYCSNYCVTSAICFIGMKFLEEPPDDPELNDYPKLRL